MLSAGKKTKGLTEFYLDGPGSTAIVIATAQVFMLNNQKEWVEL